MKKIIIILVLSVSGLQYSAADKGSALLKRIDRSLHPASYEAYRKLINIEPNGKRKQYIFYTVKKGADKVAGLFLSPASEKGRTTLRIGDNMWLYIPNVGKPIRITSLQSVVGGIFNNADILALDYSEEYNIAKHEIKGKKHILHLKAKSRSVTYDKLRMWVNMKRYLPEKIECLTAKGMLIKTIYFKKVTNFGRGIIRPAVIETDSPLYRGYKSVMIFGKIRKRSLKDEVFTLTFMSKLNKIRL